MRHRSHRLLYGGHDPGACARYFGALASWNVGYPDEFWALERAPDRAAEAPATTAAVAGLAAGLALRWLLFEDPFVAGVLLTLELGEETRLAQHAVYRVPRCAACSPAAAQAPPLPWAEAS